MKISKNNDRFRSYKKLHLTKICGSTLNENKNKKNVYRLALTDESLMKQDEE